ncbi:MAG: methyltransferase domain-containing protein [Myxococcota bacterium]|nr:methyltransferase domain-containing protein [Myxococcota bacterium]
MDREESLAEDTIRRFGVQWNAYPDNEGYYGSVALLADFIEPLVPIAELQGARVADIGSGTGRIVDMLLDAGAASVTAVEPSAAFDVLVRNTSRRRDRIEYVRGTGEELPGENVYDAVISLGVLHHIPAPEPVLGAALRALRPGGRMIAWLYGWEGNEAYLRWALPFRRLTSLLPGWALTGLAYALEPFLSLYIGACHRLPLPMRAYARNVLAHLDREQRRVTIYDQLNPAYSRYYRQEEVRQLFESAGFERVQLHHRHGYSWTVVGEKPDDA